MLRDRVLLCVKLSWIRRQGQKEQQEKGYGFKA